MLAAYAARICPDDPISGLEVGQRPEPRFRENWTVIEVKAATLNHHDLWALQGVGLTEPQLPMILGTDAAGLTPDGEAVMLHGVIGQDGHGVGPTERRSILSEKYPGTLAQYVSVPTANLVPKPAELSWAQAACLPTAYLTAYRMLFPVAGLMPGQSVLVQGVGGGVASAAIALGHAAGLEVYATSRSAAKRERALAMGATAALEAGARLPKRVDAVIESVGLDTWGHSVRSVKPGGTIAVCGATTGDQPQAELTRVFFQEIAVRGVTMGTRADLENLVNLCVRTGLRPIIDSEYPLAETARALARLAKGDQVGKIVVIPEAPTL